MNFLPQGFRKLLSSRQTDTSEITYHAASKINEKKTKTKYQTAVYQCRHYAVNILICHRKLPVLKTLVYVNQFCAFDNQTRVSYISTIFEYITFIGFLLYA